MVLPAFLLLFLLSTRCMQFNFQPAPPKIKLYAKYPAATDTPYTLICGDVGVALDSGFLDGAFAEGYEVSPSEIEYLLMKTSASQISNDQIFYIQDSTESPFIPTGRKAIVERKQIITSFIASASDIMVFSENSEGRALCVFGSVCKEKNENCSSVQISTEFHHKWNLGSGLNLSLCSVKDLEALKLYRSLSFLGSFKKPLYLFKRSKIHNKHTMEIFLTDGKLEKLKCIFEQLFSGEIEGYFDSQILWATIYSSTPGSSRIEISFDKTISNDEASAWIQFLESRGLGYAAKIKLNRQKSYYKFKSTPEFVFSGLQGKAFNHDFNLTKILDFRGFLEAFRKIKSNPSLNGFKIRKQVVTETSQATNSVMVAEKNWNQIFTGLVKALFFESNSGVRDSIESLAIHFKKEGALILLNFTEDALSSKGQVDLVNLINGTISKGLTGAIYESVAFDCIDVNKSKSLLVKNSKLSAFMTCSAFAQDSILYKLSGDIIADLPLGLSDAINMVEWSSSAWKMIIIEESLLKDEIFCIRQKSMSISLKNVSTSIGKFYQPGTFITIHPEDNSINLIMEVFRISDKGDLKKWKLSNKIESFQQYSVMKPWITGMSLQQTSPFKSSEIFKIQMDSDNGTVKDDIISKVFEGNEMITFKSFGPNLIEIHLDKTSSNNEPVFEYLGNLNFPSIYSNSHILIGDLPLYTVTFHGGKPIQFSDNQDFFSLKSRHRCDPRHVGKCSIKRISKDNSKSTLFYRSEKIPFKLYSAKMRLLLAGTLGRKAISDFQVAISSIDIERAGDNFEFKISCYDVAIEIKSAKHFKELFEAIFTVRPQHASRSAATQPRKQRVVESPKTSTTTTTTTTYVEIETPSDESLSSPNYGNIPLESNRSETVVIDSIPPTNIFASKDDITTLQALASNCTAENKSSKNFEVVTSSKEEFSATETLKATVTEDEVGKEPALIRFAGLGSEFCLELASKSSLTGTIGYSDGFDNGVYHDMDSALSWALFSASRLYAAEVTHFILRFHNDYPSLLTSDSMIERQFRAGSINELRFFDSLNVLIVAIGQHPVADWIKEFVVVREHNGDVITMKIIIKIILPNDELILLDLHEFRYMINNHLFI